jgi:hypothetical protein
MITNALGGANELTSYLSCIPFLIPHFPVHPIRSAIFPIFLHEQSTNQYAVICLVFSDYCLDFTFFGHQNYC